MTMVEEFRALHVPGEPLVLPNVWDAGSARIVASLGARALATSSAAVAWAGGMPDGGALGQEANLALAGSLVGIADVPVSIDVEDGYTNDPGAVAGFLEQLADLGVAGVNLEDASGGGQRGPQEFAEFLRSVRGSLGSAAAAVFINARIDSYLLGSGESHADVRERARQYLDAGADGIFLPGLSDLTAIGQACEELAAPVNIMVPAGVANLGELASAGVARISSGMWIAQLAHGATWAAAAGLLAGHVAVPELTAADYGDLQAQMSGSA